jgi:hypothetical protein
MLSCIVEKCVEFIAQYPYNLSQLLHFFLLSFYRKIKKSISFFEMSFIFLDDEALEREKDLSSVLTNILGIIDWNNDWTCPE